MDIERRDGTVTFSFFTFLITIILCELFDLHIAAAFVAVIGAICLWHV